MNNIEQEKQNLEGFDRVILDKMIGKTFGAVEQIGDGQILFWVSPDRDSIEGKVKFHHIQDYYENVYIESIVGNLEDLENTEILMAEEYTKEGRVGKWGVTQTHTFYRFATIKGYVDIRWVGESNGHYSESVDIEYDGL